MLQGEVVHSLNHDDQAHSEVRKEVQIEKTVADNGTVKAVVKIIEMHDGEEKVTEKTFEGTDAEVTEQIEMLK